MRKDDPQLKIRLPADLKTAVESAATSSQRTINAEVVHRLSQSFQSIEPTADFPEEVVMAVQDEMDARGGTFTEALTRLVLVGQTQGGTMFSIRVAPGMTTEAMRSVIKASEKIVPPDSSLVMVRER
jgi:hypothetical protein